MKNILITGGAGFIGSNIAYKLSAKGYAVTVLDNLSEQIHGLNSRETLIRSFEKNSIRFIIGDVRSEDDIRASLQGQNAVIHLAAETGTGQSMYDIRKYSDVNIMGTANILNYLVNSHHKVEKVVVASSRAIYGEGRFSCLEHGYVYPESRNEKDMIRGDFEVKCPYCSKPVTYVSTDEESKIHPNSIYGITKQVQEEMTLLTCGSIGIPAVALRYQNVYGPGQSLKNPYTGILSIFSTLFLSNSKVNIFEDGKESRDFVFIDDVVDATILAMERDIRGKLVLNIGKGKSVSVYDIAMLLKKAYASSSEVFISGNFRIGDIRHNFADIQRASETIGFTPSVDMEEGIDRFVKWVKNQEVIFANKSYENSLKEMAEKGLFK